MPLICPISQAQPPWLADTTLLCPSSKIPGRKPNSLCNDFPCVSVIYGYVTKHPKFNSIKNSNRLLLKSLKVLRIDRFSQTILAHGPLCDRSPMVAGLEPNFKAPIFTYPAVNAGSWLGPQEGLATGTFTCVLAMWPGLPHHKVAGFWEQISEGRKKRGSTQKGRY